MKENLIAPCGMNCNICYAHLREKDQCAGCRANAASVFQYCAKCIIRNCGHFAAGDERYCFSCPRFPCPRLKRLDQRYRAKYHLSVLENLAQIRKSGVRNFLATEKKKWKCSCGALLSCHWHDCPTCGREVATIVAGAKPGWSFSSAE